MHKTIENMILDGCLQTEDGNLTVYNASKDLDPKIASGLKEFFTDYGQHVGYGIVHAEKKLYCPTLRLAGTVDCMALAGLCMYNVAGMRAESAGH
jgi:hypothetical protein